MFRLRYYFSIISLIAIAATAYLLSAHHRQTTLEQFISLEEQSYQQLTQTIANSLLPRYRDFLVQAETMPTEELVDHRYTADMFSEVETITQKLPILKIKIFDHQGKTLFSTDPDQTGLVKPKNYPGLEVSLTGKVISKISSRDSFKKIDGSMVYDRKVMSSYLPIHDNVTDELFAVIEIYTDITDRLLDIESKQIEVTGFVLLILVLLYLILYGFVIYADRTLNRQHREHQQATELSSRLGRMLDESSNEIYVFEAENLKFTHVNEGGRENLGYSLEELYQMTPVSLKPEISREEFRNIIAPLLNGEQEQIKFETVHQRKDGSTYPVEIRLQYSPNENPPVFVAIVLDVTQQKQSEERLHYLAHYDNLTGLPNRRLFGERLERALSEASRNNEIVAVMFIDLDKFKNINDSLGHDAGDILLQQLSDRLMNCLRASDTVARWGGDEFCLAIRHIGDNDQVMVIAEKLVGEITKAFHIKSKKLFVTSSIGIALYPMDSQNIEGLFKNADAAMYHAKEVGRNNFQFYNHQMSERLDRRLEIEHELRHALERDEFVLLYQPQIDITNGSIVGMESLIRWQNPKKGLVTPDQFIGIAEETGLIVPIGEWVLREACAQHKILLEKGIQIPKVSVNLSVRQLYEPGLVERVQTILQETGHDPAMLDLEITESMLMSDVDSVIETLTNLTRLGVTISIDDFGTGHSSLAYLKQFPISTIKIDRSFIGDIPLDKDDVSITMAIINMAKGLGINTVAEGVEYAEQIDFLQSHGCKLVQGYYYSKPVSLDEIILFAQQEQKAFKIA